MFSKIRIPQCPQLLSTLERSKRKKDDPIESFIFSVDCTANWAIWSIDGYFVYSEIVASSKLSIHIFTHFFHESSFCTPLIVMVEVDTIEDSVTSK